MSPHQIPLRTLLALALTILAAPALRSASWSTLGDVHDLGPGITPGIAVDPAGTIHLVFERDYTRTSRKAWYTTNERAAAGRDVILGPEVGHEVSEFTFPVLLRDARGRIYLSYRNHATGESCLTVFDPNAERFAPPIVTAPAITRRLRWNAHLAVAPGGGAYVVWDSDGRVYFRAVGEAAQRGDP